jgi:hypothetical protein
MESRSLTKEPSTPYTNRKITNFESKTADNKSVYSGKKKIEDVGKSEASFCAMSTAGFTSKSSRIPIKGKRP